MRKHILFYSNHLRGPRGSAGARSWHQAKCLGEKYDLSVVIPMIDPVTCQYVSDESFDGLDSSTNVLKSWTIKNYRSSKLLRGGFFISAMCSQFCNGLLVKKKPDLVLTMSLPVTLLFVAVITSKLRRVPLIVDVRDLPFEMASEIGYLGSKKFVRILKYIENSLLRCASAVITNSPRYKGYLLSYGITEEIVTIAPIGYDNFTRPQTESSIIDSRHTLLDLFPCRPKFVAIYAGTIGFAFPVGEILKAAKLIQTSDIGFLFVGDGQQLNQSKAFAIENKINAVFTGRVTKSDVHKLCEASDVCMYPAVTGEFSSAILGNKVFDYLGAGKPVIYIGPDSAVSDLINELAAGVVVRYQDYNGFAKSIISLMENTEHLNELSKNAKGLIAAGYSARNSALKLRKIIGIYIK